MTFEQIAAEYTWGSAGFIKAFQTHMGIDISDSEIERIADRTSTPDEFMDVWENDDDWTDEAQG
jgi:hypothetical protein